MGYGKVVIRSDQEPAITALVDKIKEIRESETLVEWAPRGDKNANGLAERGVQAAEGMARTLKVELEERLNGNMPADHPVMAWLIRHAADKFTKHEVKGNGKTSYEMLKGRPYGGHVASFGQKVMYLDYKWPR